MHLRQKKAQVWGSGYCVGDAGSRLAFRWMEPPVTLSVLVQLLNPFFLTVIRWLPGTIVIVDGVLPTKEPSTSMSAPGGVDSTERTG